MKVLVATTPKDGLVGVEVACGICHSRFEIEHDDLSRVMLSGRTNAVGRALSPSVFVDCPTCNSLIECGALDELAG